MYVNNLPNVVSRQCPGAESNLHPRVSSGLQVRHVTIRLPSLLACKRIAATGTLHPNHTEEACLRRDDVRKKKPCGSFNVALDCNADIWLVRWNDSKVVTIASRYVEAKPFQETKRFSSKEETSTEVDQPKVVQTYNYGMGEVDRTNQTYHVK